MMHLSSCLATIAVCRTSASNYIRRSSKNSRWRLFGEHQSSSTPKGAESPTSYTTKMSCRSSRKSEKQRKFKCSYSLKAINLIIYQKSANSSIVSLSRSAIDRNIKSNAYFSCCFLRMRSSQKESLSRLRITRTDAYGKVKRNATIARV